MMGNMKIFSVNQIARDLKGCRDISEQEHSQKPFRCFTHLVVADSWQQAIEKVKQQDGLPSHWGDVFYQIHDKEGRDISETVFIGITDQTAAETDSFRRYAA